MARKAIVDRETVLNLLKAGNTTQSIAERYGVSRQAIDLHRRDFINRGLLDNQRANRHRSQEIAEETGAVEASTTHQVTPLDEQIDLLISAFSALKRLPKLERELEQYRDKYQTAEREIERLREVENKRQEQELRWQNVQKKEG